MENEDDIIVTATGDPIATMAEGASRLIRDRLAEGRKVLLLLPGSLSVALAPVLGSHLADHENHKLTVAITNDRYATSPAAPISYGGGVVRAGLANTLLGTGAQWEPLLHGQSLAAESRAFQLQLGQAAERGDSIIALLLIDEFGAIAGIKPDEDVGRFHERFASDQLAIGYPDGEGEALSITLSGLHTCDHAIVLAPNRDAAELAASSEEPIHLQPSTVCQELSDVAILHPAA